MDSKYKTLEVQIKKKLSGDFLGSFQSAFKGLGSEFDSLREYIPGDSIKAIDWKSTAKLGNVHVKNYEEEKDLKVLFLIDNSPSLSFGSENITKRETVKEIFFLLAYSSIKTGHSIGSLTNGNFIDFKRGEENILKTLKNLEILSINNKNIRLHIKKLNIKNTLIFILTDSLTPDSTELKYLNIFNEVVYINIFDYFENNLSNDAFESSFSDKIGTLFFGKNKTIDQYKKLRSNKIEILKKNLKKSEIEYLRLDDRNDLFLEFFKFFTSYKK